MITLPQSAPVMSRRGALRASGLSAAALTLAPGLVRASDAKPSSATPAPAGSQPGFYRFNIGAFEAIAFTDGALAGPLSVDIRGTAIALQAVKPPFVPLKQG